MDKRIIDAISQAQSGKRMSILDIGARGGLQWPWNGVPRELINATLVEPDPIEAERLTKQWANTDHSLQVLPFALWGSCMDLTLNINRSAGTSSILKPNRDFLNLFPESERFDILQRLLISAVTLDHLEAQQLLTPPDFAKIDVQGAELEVLMGGKRVLRDNLVGLEVEVEFSQMYENQPLFRHIDEFVQDELGLALWDLRGSYWRYKEKSFVGGSKKGQLVFADALYLMPLPRLLIFCDSVDAGIAKHKVISLVLTSILFGYYDYAARILNDKKLVMVIGGDDAKLILDMMSRQVHLRGSFLGDRTAGMLFRTFGLLTNVFRFTHNDWAISKENLGSRKFGPFWWF